MVIAGMGAVTVDAQLGNLRLHGFGSRVTIVAASLRVGLVLDRELQPLPVRAMGVVTGGTGLLINVGMNLIVDHFIGIVAFKT